jgi:hypothetical protein
MGGTPTRPVIIVTETLARQLFGNADPVGRSVEFRTIDQAGRAHEIVGVAGDARFDSLTAAVPPMAYQPAGPDSVARNFTFVIRSAPGVDVAGAVRRTAAALNPSLPVVLPMSVEEGVSRWRAEWDVLSRLMTGLPASSPPLACMVWSPSGSRPAAASSGSASRSGPRPRTSWRLCSAGPWS